MASSFHDFDDEIERGYARMDEAAAGARPSRAAPRRVRFAEDAGDAIEHGYARKDRARPVGGLRRGTKKADPIAAGSKDGYRLYYMAYVKERCRKKEKVLGGPMPESETEPPKSEDAAKGVKVNPVRAEGGAPEAEAEDKPDREKGASLERVKERLRSLCSYSSCYSATFAWALNAKCQVTV